MKKLILCSLFMILSSCTATPTASVSSTDADEVVAPSPTAQSMKRKAGSCICTKIWMPVCGENNKTYGNSCEADCAGVKYTGGSCEEKE